MLFCLFAKATQSQVINVSTAAQLKDALNGAQPGHIIKMADGVYDLPSLTFRVEAGINGTASQPITLTGSRNAIITNSDSSYSYALWLKGNKYWVLKGFTVKMSKVGIKIDSSLYITVDSVKAVKCGAMGISLSRRTRYCTVKNCYIDSTGLHDIGVGEGVYIGTDQDSWCNYNYCAQDSSNYNQVLNNTFGSHLSAENVDVKEGTRGGLIKGNTFNGAGLANQNGGDTWIEIKGNNYIIENNIGYNSYKDGFSTAIKSPGWGDSNIFRNNVLYVNAPGYGIRIVTSYSPYGIPSTALHNLVCSNNVVTGAASGFSNVAVTNCSSTLAVKLIKWNVTSQGNNLKFSWIISNEQDALKFYIEESLQGTAFKQLAAVDPAGSHYEHVMEKSLISGSYFRLKIVNKDGSQSYSDVVFKEREKLSFTVKYDRNTLAIINPFHTVQVQLADVQGKILKSVSAGTGVIYLDVKNLPAAAYFIRILNTTSKEIYTKKIII